MSNMPLNVLLFGGTGMVGQGVLRECLRDPKIARVAAVGRSHVSQEHAKLFNIKLSDLTNYASIEPQLSGFNACFFCLGISSAGLTEAAYRYTTYDIALAAARHSVQDTQLSNLVPSHGAGAVAAASDSAELRDHHGADGQGNVAVGGGRLRRRRESP